MRLKLTIEEKPKHTDFATCVAWNNADEVYSCGDDHQLLQWNVFTNATLKVADLPQDLFPISIQWPPKTSVVIGGGTRKTNEFLLLTSSDGNFHLLGRTGRIEKSVQAHKGAVLSGSWNHDGSEILTSGEDGNVRIWSRVGMMRTTLSQCPVPVYSSSWGPDGQSVVHTNENSLVIKTLSTSSSSSKNLSWVAHDGLILCVNWCFANGMIISGGEDCRYKVWDDEGRPIFSSLNYDHPITSLAWTRSGELFTVGGFNTLRLCDRFGWSHCLEKPKVGSIYAMSWSNDGTQLAAVGASGHVFLGSVVEKNVSWKTTEATIIGRRSVNVTEFTTNNKEKLEFRDRIIKISLDHGYIVAITQTQVYIYTVGSLNTPVISDLRENNSISLILQSKWQFALCGNIMVTIWTYDGRLVSNIKWAGFRPDLMNTLNATLAIDVIAFRDQLNQKLIRIFDPSNGKQLGEIKTGQDIRQISLAKNEYAGTSERVLAIVDKNQDLFLSLVKKFGQQESPIKLTSMAQSVIWQNEVSILAVIREGKLRIYYFPQILFLDPTLVDYSYEDKDLGDLGSKKYFKRYPELLSYESNRISIRRPDGVLITSSASPIVPHLHKHAVNGKFVEAKRIVRYVNDKLLWGVMAGLSTWKEEISLMEICFAEIGQNDKVFYIQEVKGLEDEISKKSSLKLICQGINESETYLLQNGRDNDAIQMLVNSHEWGKALDLATKNQTGFDFVLGSRKFYLHLIKEEEYLEKYKNFNGSAMNSKSLQGQTSHSHSSSTSSKKKKRHKKKELSATDTSGTGEGENVSGDFHQNDENNININLNKKEDEEEQLIG